MKKLIPLLCLLLCSCVGWAQSHPGSVDFQRFGNFDESRVTLDLTLGGWLLSWAQVIARDSADPDLQILSKVDSVRVRVFEVQDQRISRATATTVVDELRTQGWEQLAKINDTDSWVHILVKGQGDLLEGITVIALDTGDEAVFINIAGRLHPQDVARLLDDEDLLQVKLDLDWEA